MDFSSQISPLFLFGYAFRTLWLFCPGFPTSQGLLPLERGGLALGDPLGGLQSSVCHCLCLGLQRVSYCFHIPTPGAPWGDGVARTHQATGIGKRDQRKERGRPDGRTPLNPSLLSLAPLFSYPLFTVFSEHPMCPM